MRTTSRLGLLLSFVALLLMTIWILWGVLAQPPHLVLGYPPPTSVPPLQPYPPPAILPLPGQSVTLGPHPSQTPWVAPTAYLVTPALTPRQGASGDIRGHALVQLASWSPNWSWISLGKDPNPPGIEHVGMLAWKPWGIEGTTTPPPNPTSITTIVARLPHNYWLLFNECDSPVQCNTSASFAAEWYANRLVPYIQDFYPAAAEDPQFIVGGVNANECGILWLSQFLDRYRAITQGSDPPYLAGWHFHIYPEMVPAGWLTDGLLGCNTPWVFYNPFVQDADTAWERWYEQTENIKKWLYQYGQEDKEVWITEMGCLTTTREYGEEIVPAVCDTPDGAKYEYVSRITNWLNQEGRWIDRYAWFISWDTDFWRETHLYDLTATPTATLTLTPTPTFLPVGPSPAPSRTPTPTPTPRHPLRTTPSPTPTTTPTLPFTSLGRYYSQITPQAAVNLPPLGEHSFLPILFR